MVSVRSALMMLCMLLNELSSHISPDGMSIEIVRAWQLLMNTAMAANPLLSGLLMPVPNRPSIMVSSSLICGVSNVLVTSMKLRPVVVAASSLAFWQLSESLPVVLKRYIVTSCPELQRLSPVSIASPPLLPGPAKMWNRPPEYCFSISPVSALAARCISS